MSAASGPAGALEVAAGGQAGAMRASLCRMAPVPDPVEVPTSTASASRAPSPRDRRALPSRIRSQIDESPKFLAIEEERRRPRKEAPPLSVVVRGRWRRMLFFISILMSHMLLNYLLLGFLATYLTHFVKIDETDASLAP